MSCGIQDATNIHKGFHRIISVMAKTVQHLSPTADGSEILHELRLVAYPIIYMVLETFQVVENGISEPATIGVG